MKYKEKRFLRIFFFSKRRLCCHDTKKKEERKEKKRKRKRDERNFLTFKLWKLHLLPLGVSFFLFFLSPNQSKKGTRHPASIFSITYRHCARCRLLFVFFPLSRLRGVLLWLRDKIIRLFFFWRGQMKVVMLACVTPFLGDSSPPRSPRGIAPTCITFTKASSYALFKRLFAVQTTVFFQATE